MSAVLAVVLMVLKIIGMILLALLLLLLLALLLPAGIHFRWSHIGGLRLQLCYGPLHFTLYPRKADEEEKKAEPKAETKQGNTPKTEPTSAAPPSLRISSSRKSASTAWKSSFSTTRARKSAAPIPEIISSERASFHFARPDSKACTHRSDYAATRLAKP